MVNQLLNVNFTQISCQIMDHYSLPVQLCHGDTVCLHVTIGPNSSQLCKHLEITTIEPSRQQKFFIMWRLIEALPLLCLFCEAAIKPAQVVFHPSCESSPIILLVRKFRADLLCPRAVIWRYYNSSRCCVTP